MATMATMNERSNMTDLHVDTSPDDEPGLPSAAPFEVPNYAVAPEDQPYVDRVLAMDPVADVPGPATLKGELKVPAKFTLATLPVGPLRDEVEQRLASVRPPASKYEETVHEFVAAALRKNSLDVRAAWGVSGEALPYWKEMGTIASEGRRCAQEFDQLATKLNEVSHYETRLNEQTGEQEPWPVMVLEGDGRTAALRQMTTLAYKMKLLNGIEGQRRLDRAMLETVKLLKAREAQVADEAEIARLTDERERQSRIEARVAAKLRMRGVEVKD
jgi:hypothetical protein